MADPTLVDLLDRNRTHTESIPDGYFDGVREAQRPSVVSVCCSDSRVSQEGMWSVDEPGWLFTPSNIGNQTWDVHDGERVVSGNLLYPVVHTDTRTVAVVGHTGCGAVTAAHEAVAGEGDAEEVLREREPPGIGKWVASLLPVVEEGLAAGVAEDADDDAAAVNRLVEFNVDRQVAFLRAADSLPSDAHVYGFVYDFQGVYGDVPGRTYLVNHEGETDADAVADRLPDGYGAFARRLR